MCSRIINPVMYWGTLRTHRSSKLWIIENHRSDLLRLCLPSSRSSGFDYSSSIVLEAWSVPWCHKSTQRSGQPSPWWSSLFGRQEGWADTHLLVRRKMFHIHILLENPWPHSLVLAPIWFVSYRSHAQSVKVFSGGFPLRCRNSSNMIKRNGIPNT